MRRQYEAELIPQVMAMGIGYEEFWTLNPRKIKVISEAYSLKRQIQDEELWLLGEYVFNACSIALGNAFRKKGQKSKEYFEIVKEPILRRVGEERDANNLTESEKKEKTELLFKNLEILAANHRLSKK